MAIPASEIEAACFEPPTKTNGFRMQQTMIRVKDPRVSLTFYTQVLGMRLLKRLDCSLLKFSLYFVGYADENDIPEDRAKRAEFCLNQLGTIELTHNWGTENEPGDLYHNGNTEPRGFGHLGILVQDVSVACERFDKLGVPFIKKPDGGKLKGVGFIQDPDGYWIEILSQSAIKQAADAGIVV